jgi:uncharacterized protein YjbI with pentapeptide repeats
LKIKIFKKYMKLNKILKIQIFILIFLVLIFLMIKIEFNIYFEEFALWLYPNNENRNAELFKILLTVIGGLGVLFSLYLGFKKSKAMENGIRLQGLAIDKQSEQLELSRKSQIDERFKNAVEHLGSDKEPIILGGVAELYQIAIENSNEYAEIVFNILTSYIRTSTNIHKKKADDFSVTIIQTIINYLFKSKSKNNYPFLGFTGNLSASNLNSINIDSVDFVGFNLSFTLFPMYINDVDFSDSNLSKAQFSLSRINNCDFSNTNLHSTYFHFSEIRNSSFEEASILATNFLSTSFKDVNFNNCDFSNAKFICCFFNNTTHIQSNIISNDFSFSSFKNVDFSSTKLFSKNNFQGCYFYNFSINTMSMEINFNGCGILDTSFMFDYPVLVDKLEERIGKDCNNSQIINLSNVKLDNQLTFEKLNETDILKIREKYKSIEEEFSKLKNKKNKD